MNHEAASERLLELAYGDLPPREARAVEAHAAACDACRAELARMRETRALMARLPVEPPPEGGMAVVMAAARQAAEASPRRRTILPAWLWAGGIGAVAAAAVAVVSWQLARTAPAVTGAERETELLGRGSSMGVPSSPPPGERVGASRQPAAPAPSDGIAPAPPPAERLGVREQPVAPAPSKGIAPAPPPAERLGVREQPVASAPTKGIAPSPPPGERVGVMEQPAASAPSKGIPPSPPPGERVGVRGPADRGLGALGALGATGGGAGGAGGGAGGSAAGAAAKWDRVEEAPAPMAAPAPAPAQKARSAAATERKAAAPAAADAGQERLEAADSSARGRAAALRAEAAAASEPGSVETRYFEGCPGERARIVRRDAEGRIVSYVRILADSRRIDQSYGPDGRLVRAGIAEGKVARVLPLDTPWLVRDARDAGMDAPPRCEVP